MDGIRTLSNKHAPGDAGPVAVLGEAERTRLRPRPWAGSVKL